MLHLSGRSSTANVSPGQVRSNLPAMPVTFNQPRRYYAIQLTNTPQMAHRRQPLLLTATPSFALFGIGDIVFDPTSYASLVQQLTTLQMQYNMVKNNITHFSLKQQWQTTLHTLENVNVANMFGETARHQRSRSTPTRRPHRLRHGRRPRCPMNSSTTSYLAGQTLGSAASRSLP